MNLPARRANRLKEFDYSSSGVYFVTLCVKARKNLLWANQPTNTLQTTTNARTVVGATIGHAIQQMKGAIAKQIGYSIWQKSFHDHIVRDERDYLQIWDYIDTHPVKWKPDRFYNAE